MSTTGKLTAEFLKANRVAFYPQTAADAAAIQRWLFRHDINWIDKVMEVRHLEGCVAKGMYVADGKLLYNPGKASVIQADINDLEGLCEADYGPEVRMERRLEQLESEVKELHGKIDTLITLLQPRVTIDKAKGMKP